MFCNLKKLEKKTIFQGILPNIFRSAKSEKCSDRQELFLKTLMNPPYEICIRKQVPLSNACVHTSHCSAQLGLMKSAGYSFVWLGMLLSTKTTNCCTYLVAHNYRYIRTKVNKKDTKKGSKKLL